MRCVSLVLSASAALGAGGSSCASGGLRGGEYVDGALRYRVAVPAAPAWREVRFSGNDLAWVADGSGHLLAMNATCTEHGDPSLEVLTGHLLFGFGERVLQSRRTETLDGRAALFSTYRATLDGVPRELQLVVLKKNGCVHDFTYVSPVGQAGRHQADFDRLVASFSQVASP